MTRIEKFEDIIAWQKADLLVIDLYKIFSSLKDFSFKDQILRAAVSIMNNIAEGFEGKATKTLENFCISQRVLVQRFVQCFGWPVSLVMFPMIKR